MREHFCIFTAFNFVCVSNTIDAGAQRIPLITINEADWVTLATGNMMDNTQPTHTHEYTTLNIFFSK